MTFEMTEETLQKVAHHEAAHVLVGMSLGKALSSVSIDPEEGGFYGVTIFITEKIALEGKDAVVAAAGKLGEQLIGEPLPVPDQIDDKMVEQFLLIATTKVSRLQRCQNILTIKRRGVLLRMRQGYDLLGLLLLRGWRGREKWAVKR